MAESFLPLMGLVSLQKNPLIGDWLEFADGRVFVKTGKVEIGQGIHSALATIAADELQVPIWRVNVRAVSTRDSPDEDYTAGSLSITQSGAALSLACSAARMLLLAEAAGHLGVEAKTLSIIDGGVQAKGRSITYWDALPAHALASRIDEIPIQPLAAMQATRSYGDGLRHDLAALFAGRRRFIQDLDLPGLLYGRVVRPPPPQRALVHFEDTRARGLPGVLVVRDGNFVGVVAEREEMAVRAVDCLNEDCRWADAMVPPFDAAGVWLKTHAGPAEVVLEQGQALPDSPSLEATYTKPHIAHASIGPSAAVARFDARGGLEVWSHTQGVFPLKRELAKVLRIPVEQVHVTHVEGSGCYGHNGAEDAALDAAVLARAVPGRPVKVQWTRADEAGHEPYGPAMRMHLAATLDPDGHVTAWRHDFWSNGHVGRPGFSQDPVLLAAAEIDPPFQLAVASDPPMPPGGSQRNSVPLYAFPSVRVVRHPVAFAPLRVSSLRALGSFGNLFAIESFMDELAAAAGLDPLEFRLRHLSDPRAREVLETAAGHVGWHEPRREGAGLGLGFARYKNSAAYCAVVAEVNDSTALGVSRLVVCVDTGRVVALDGVRNQVEGGAIQAASWTLKEAVRARDGVPPLDWDQYPILRFSEVPIIETIVLDRAEAPSLGVGECTQGPVAAAIANAFAAAYGVRIRDLPITRERVLAALQE